MRIIKFIATALVALPFVLAATVGEAQQKQAKKQVNQSDAAAIEARHQCFLEAQARVPGAAIGGGEMSERTSAYMSCAQRKGVRP